MILKILKPWMNQTLNIQKNEHPWTSLNSLTIRIIHYHIHYHTLSYIIMHHHTSSYIIISIQYIHIYTNLCWLRCFAKGRLFEFSYWRPCLPTCMRNFNARIKMEMDCRTELSRCSSHFKPDSLKGTKGSWIPIQSGSSHFHAMGLWFLHSHFWKCLFQFVCHLFNSKHVKWHNSILAPPSQIVTFWRIGIDLPGEGKWCFQVVEDPIETWPTDALQTPFMAVSWCKHRCKHDANAQHEACHEAIHEAIHQQINGLIWYSTSILGSWNSHWTNESSQTMLVFAACSPRSWCQDNHSPPPARQHQRGTCNGPHPNPDPESTQKWWQKWWATRNQLADLGDEWPFEKWSLTTVWFPSSSAGSGNMKLSGQRAASFKTDSIPARFRCARCWLS